MRVERVICPKCGVVKERPGYLAKRGWSALCQPCSVTRHGGTGTRLHSIWLKMRERCGLTNHRHKAHDRYAGRGIAVCQEWAASFEVFRDWALTNGYADTLTIDRRDNDKGYSPDNCRWVTRAENNRNSSRAKLDFAKARAIRELVRAGGKHAAIGEMFGVSRPLVSKIMKGEVWAET